MVLHPTYECNEEDQRCTQLGRGAELEECRKLEFPERSEEGQDP